MSSDLDQRTRNRLLASRFVAAMNERDFEALDELVADDFSRHSPSTPDVVVTNRDEFKAFLHQDLRGVPNSFQRIQMMVAEGDLVAVWASYQGTQDGPMGPFPASGRPVDIEFAAILRVENDRIAEAWVVWDNLGMLIQLGHLTPPGS